MGDGEESGRGVVGRRRHLTHKLWQWGIKRSWGCEDIKDTSADRTWQLDGHHRREGGQHLSRLYQEGFPSLFSDKQGRPDKPEQAVTRAWLRPSQTGMLGWISWLRKGLHWISGRSWNVYSGVILQAFGVKQEEERGDSDLGFRKRTTKDYGLPSDRSVHISGHMGDAPPFPADATLGHLPEVPH